MAVTDLYKAIPGWVKTTSAGMSLIIMIVGAVIAAEDRYVNEQEAAQTIQQLQKNLEQQINMNQYDFAVEQYIQQKIYLQKNPNDSDAQEQLERWKSKKEKLEIKLKME